MKEIELYPKRQGRPHRPSVAGLDTTGYGAHSWINKDFSEIRLIPKASSTGAEGTMFYDSDDKHVYVATE